MEEYIYRKARERVRKKKGFYGHLSAYLAVGVFFLVMNMVTDPWDLWFFYPMMPWGVGLLIHYFGVFGLPGREKVLTKSWEEREMEKEMQRLRRKHQPPEEAPKDFLDLKDIRKEKVKSKKWDDSDLV